MLPPDIYKAFWRTLSHVSTLEYPKVVHAQRCELSTRLALTVVTGHSGADAAYNTQHTPRSGNRCKRDLPLAPALPAAQRQRPAVGFSTAKTGLCRSDGCVTRQLWRVNRVSSA
jgi:hypothetical protein